jgi:hypothetical protein
MIDLRTHGLKCRAVRDIRDYQGVVSASAEGPIEYEVENLGRHLININVQWDNNGVRLNVLGDDIEIIGGDRL